MSCLLSYLLGTNYSSITSLFTYIMRYSPIVSYANPVLTYLSKKGLHFRHWHRFTSQIAHLHPIHMEKAKTYLKLAQVYIPNCAFTSDTHGEGSDIYENGTGLHPKSRIYIPYSSRRQTHMDTFPMSLSYKTIFFRP